MVPSARRFPRRSAIVVSAFLVVSGAAAREGEPAVPTPAASTAAPAALAPASAAEITPATATATATATGTGTATARAARLQGAALFERNRPVVGATVVVIPESGGEVVLTTTDLRGAFRIDGIPDGLYTVLFQRGGLESLRKEHVELKAPFRPTVEVIMRPGGAAPPRVDSGAEGLAAVAGRATDRDGAAVADLKLRLIRVSGSVDPVDRVTDLEGAFSVADLAVDEWVLEAKGLAYLPLRAALPLRAGDNRLRLVLVPQPPAHDPIPLDLLPTEEPIPPPGS